MSNIAMVEQEENDDRGGRQDSSNKEKVERKTISISAKTHRELDSIGLRGDTFDDIIQKCIQAYKREQQHRSSSSREVRKKTQ